MIELIKTYEGKTGAVNVYRYAELGHTQYRVVHEGSATIGAAWFGTKRDAIVHAQFISRY